MGLSAFAESLDESPVFSKIPLELFLTDGAPGADAWREKWNDKSGLRNVRLRDVYVVLSAIELEIAAFALLEHQDLANKEDVDEEGAM